MTKTDRVGFVDLFRGVGILLMIIGHVGFWGDFSYFSHAFHMPMFFFVTGYFWKQDKLTTFLTKKTRSLLGPYFVWTLFHFCIWIFIRTDSDQSIGEALYHIFFINTTQIPLVGIWFLTALFWASVIYYFVDLGIKNIKVKALVMACIGIAGNIMPGIYPSRLPWALDAAMVGSVFIFLGVYFRDYHPMKIDFLNIKLKYIIPLACIITFVIFLNSEVNMRTGSYGIIPLFWLNSIVSIIVLWNLCRFIDGIKKYPFITIIENEVRFIGKNSICYLCFNISILLLIQFVLECANINGILSKLIEFIVILISIHWISILLSGKMKFLIGRR